MSDTYLIVNADDFGLCEEVNNGVIAAFDSGIVTSASLMVRWPAAREAAAHAAVRPDLAVGLHVDLGEWERNAEGDWVERYAVVDHDDLSAVAGEVSRQLIQFRALTGHEPTHLDGHQHVQRAGGVAEILERHAARLGVPLRLHDPRINYRGDFYGQDHHGHPYPRGIAVANLIDVISTLAPGWSELGCHPGLGVPVSMTPYASERAIEVVALCHPEVARAVERYGVTLVSFSDL